MSAQEPLSTSRNSPAPAEATRIRWVNDPSVILRRAALWTVLCSVTALPSFLVARAQFNDAAMAMGVLIFIGLYTAVSSTAGFHRFSRRPFVRRTLYIGYTLRVIASILFPIGTAIDLIPGIISVELVDAFFRTGAGDIMRASAPRTGFLQTLLTTIVHGALLNLILGAVMLVLYGFQRLFLKPPARDVGRCETCGYDLRASYEFGRCPECGTPCAAPGGPS